MKKKMRSILSLALAVLMLISVVPLTASAVIYEDESFTYTVTDGKATITGYEGTSTDLIIPAEVDGYPVVAIVEGALTNKSITQITLPSTVKDFYVYSFYGKKIVIDENNPYFASDEHSVIYSKDGKTLIFAAKCISVDYAVPEGVEEISPYAFSGQGNFLHCYYDNYNRVSWLRIPSSVKSIPRNAFEGTGSIPRFSVDENNPYYSSDEYGVLFDKNKEIIYMAPYTKENSCFASFKYYCIPETVKEIADYAFFGYDQENIFITENVTKIGSNAFTANSIPQNGKIHLYIPKSVAFLADDFAGNGKISIFYEGSQAEWESLYSANNNLMTVYFEHRHVNTSVAETCTKKVHICDDCGIANVFENIEENHEWYVPVNLPYCQEYFDVPHCCYGCDAEKLAYVAPIQEHYWYINDSFPACVGGTAHYRCEICWTEKDEYIEPTEHNFIYENCDYLRCEGGYANLYCDSCHLYYDIYIEAEGHDWYTNDNIPSCAGGTATYYCYNCSTTKTEEIAPTEEHDWYTYDTFPSCAGGTATYNCKNCSATKEEYIAPTKEHSWYTKDKIHSCAGGTATYNCKNCSATKEEYIAPTEDHWWVGGPDYDGFYCVGGMASYFCNYCYTEKEEYVEPLGHAYEYVSDNNATCTEDGTKHEACSRCSYKGETVIDEGSKLGHDLTETTVLSQQSCTQDGISVQACKRCAEIVATSEGAYGHYDSDGDGKCDECKVVLEVILPEVPSEPETDVTPEEPETPEEPQESNILAKIIEFFNKIINILKKLFGI